MLSSLHRSDLKGPFFSFYYRFLLLSFIRNPLSAKCCPHSTAPSCGASCLPIKIRDRSFALLSDRNLSTPHGRTSSLKRYRFNKTLNLPCLAICRRRQKQRYSPLRPSRFWKLSVKFTRICFVGLCNGIAKKRGGKLFPYYRPAAVYRDTTR